MLLAGCGAVGQARPKSHVSTTTTVVTTSTSATTSTVPAATSTTTTTTVPTPTEAPPAPALLTNDRSVPSIKPAGTTLGRADIPWSAVGPGWTLSLYDSTKGCRCAGGPPPKPPTEGVYALFLVSPIGTRYVIDHWPAMRNVVETLLGWAPSSNDAVVQSQWTIGSSTPYLDTVIDLRSGTASSYSEAASTLGSGGCKICGAISHTFAIPGSRDYLVDSPSSGSQTAPTTVQVTDAAGHVLRNLGTFAGLWGEPLAGPEQSFVISTGLAETYLVTAAGARVNIDPPSIFCVAAGFYSVTTVLARCAATANDVIGGGSDQWLLSVDGQSPRDLNIPISKTVGPTPWGGQTAQVISIYPLPTGEFYQVAGACATVYIGEQEPGAKVRFVTIPGVSNDASMEILGSTGDDLLVGIANDCGGLGQLIGLNPATDAARTLLLAPDGTDGLVGQAVLYPQLESYSDR